MRAGTIFTAVPTGIPSVCGRSGGGTKRKRHYLSSVQPDGDQGFPGNLEASVTYELTGDGALKIHYEAVSDQSTLINMTNHGYFNLNGHDSGNVLNQWMELEAEYYTPVCASSALPTGEIREVAGTPFDFRRPRRSARRLKMEISRSAGRRV